MLSVTEVLDYLTEPELLNWFITKGKAACKKIGDEAKRVGSLVDQLVQQDIKVGEYAVPNGDTQVAICMVAWEKFKVEHTEFKPSIVSMQTELVDDGIVGHPDFIRVDQITDLKTSRAIHPRYWTQTAKYAKMAGKNKISILRLDKESGMYEYKEQGEDVVAYENQVFEAYLVAFRHNTIIREIIRKQLELEVLGVA